MGRNKKLAAGILFLLVAALFIFSIVQGEMKSHLLTGAIICLLLGFGFLRNSRRS